MYNSYIHHGYRRLTEKEAEKATKAIDWLASKRLKAEQIVMLTERNLDRESKALYVRIETRHVIWCRKIRYAESEFDLYLTEVLPCLNTERWLFPSLCWTGRKRGFGFHLKAEDVENYLAKGHKMVLIKGKRYDNIEVSTKKANIQNQNLVGRRIALRA